MEHSLFFRFRNAAIEAPPITFLLLESVQAVIEQNPQITFQAVIEQAAKTTYQAKPSAKALEALSLAFYQDAKERAAEVKDTKPSTVKLALGSTYMQWLGDTSAEQLCFVLAGFDSGKAEKLYCEVDYRIVNQMAELYVAQQWKLVEANFEACMYGFGGGYKGGPTPGDGGDGNVVDLTKGVDSVGQAALKSMGF